MKTNLPQNGVSKYSEKIETKHLNYADSLNWLSIPHAIKNIDVFYLYPTVSNNERGIMDVTNDDERDLAKGVFKAQASLFMETCNTFAPYYRQVSTTGRPDQEGVSPTDCDEFHITMTDVLDSFEYFLNELNNDRPFIVAGHSQGAMAMLELLKCRFSYDQKLRSRLVAAYIIGCTVTNDDLKTANIHAARHANDTGVIITFNTQSYTSQGGPMLTEGAHCINPLNWRTDANHAQATKNKGARIYNNSTGKFLYEINNYCDAQINIETGGLMTKLHQTEIEKLDFGDYDDGVYHRYDYAFWYRNLQENVHNRIRAFLEKN